VSSVVVELVAGMDREIYDAIESLVPQLSPASPLPSYDQLAEIVASPATRLFVARDAASRRIVGMLTLVTFRIPTGLRARIEDVVVDSKARGGGIGKELCLAAIQAARELGAAGVDLTSHPKREAANRLYRSLGFTIRETNVYWFNMEKE
jgi:ribosomal protein S18 acetylase RimI-like enzyme